MFQEADWGRIFRIIAIAIIAGLLFFVFMQVRQVFTPFIFAGIITYVLNPVVDYASRKGMTRGQAIAATYLMLMVLMVLLAIYVVPVFIVEVNRLVANVPNYVEDIQQAIFEFEGYYARSALPASVRDAINQSIETNLGKIEEHTAAVLTGLVTGVMGFFGGLFNLVLGPVLAAYMLKDFRRFHDVLENAFAPHRRAHVQRFLADINQVLSGFFHGRLIVSVVVGVLTALVLQFMGVRFAMILGVVAGLTNLIPYFGPFIGAIPALVIAGLESWRLFAQVGILYVVVQQLDGFVISPRILGKRTGLHPLAVIFAVMAGGVLFGFWGLFLGVPVAAVIKVCIDHVFVWTST